MRAGIVLRSLWLSVLAVPGCIGVHPEADYHRAGRYITDATGSPQVYDPADEERVEEHVGQLLADGLTADEAVQVCLLNSPRLQALYEQIGMVRADVVQSQLLSNPTVGVSARFPAGGGLLNLEANFAQNLVDLWQIPQRRHAAERALEQAILDVAHEASAAAAEAKRAYYDAAAADRLRTIADENRDTAQRLAVLAENLRDAGAGSGVDVNLARSALQEAELALATAGLDSLAARVQLLRSVGATADPSGLVLVTELPGPPALDISPAQLLELAARHRLDIAAAREELAALATNIELEKQRVFPVVEVGVEVEREARRRSGDGTFAGRMLRSSLEAGQPTLPGPPEPDEESIVVVGPTLTVELPIFDQNQAQIAKAEYAYRQAAKEVRALLVDITLDARLAHERATTAWAISRAYEAELLPLRERNLDLAREAYQAGKIPLIPVLEVQRTLQEARASFVRALRDTALAWVELERVTARPMEQWDE